MLGFYRMSLTGTAHLAAGEDAVCQDANAVKILAGGWVVAVIADGLGSAKYSDAGSSTAVNTVIRFVEEYLPSKWHEASLISLMQTAFHSALKAIQKTAEEKSHELKEYDTTLTALIYNGTNVVFGHVGDGGIIALSRYGDFSIMTKAQKGEEFNVVVPLRMGPENWIFGTSKDPVCALIMMTDGIYDIACPWLLVKQDIPIYINYIRPFMDTNILNVKTQDDFEKAQEEITSFFQGKNSEQITDDKTIVGIINTDVKPENKPGEYYAEPDWETLSRQHKEGLYGQAKKPALEKNPVRGKKPFRKRYLNFPVLLLIVIAAICILLFKIISPAKDKPELSKRQEIKYVCL
jgi:serine/threonine protein phosphatase PrpC